MKAVVFGTTFLVRFLVMNSRPASHNALHRGILLTGVVAALATMVIQWRLISKLRRDNESLNTRAVQQEVAVAEGNKALAARIAQLEQQQNEAQEIARLRNQNGMSKQALAPSPARPIPNNLSSTNNTPPAAPNSSNAVEDSIRTLAFAASQGDFTALDKLAELAAASIQARTNDQQWVLGDVKLAFNLLGAEAGKGNDLAFQSIWRATRMAHLKGLATRALGEAAALGNEKALEPLLDPERFLLMRSSTISALKPVAEAGNARAIEALAAVAADEKAKALWYMTAEGLESAAISGNATAIDALAAIAKSDNRSVREKALLALENSAFKKNARATEALRSLGYQ